MKKTIAIFLSLVLLAALAVSAGAEPAFLHPFTRVEDGTLYLAGAPAEDGAVTVNVNGQSFSQFRVTTVEEAELPITYYCIVDQSSSLSDSQKQQERRALTALSDAMRPMDTMVLVLMGEELSFGEPLTTPEARRQGIEEACVFSAKFTNLNASVAAAMETIAAARDDESLGCILLLTDGLDNARIAVSREALTQTIRDTGLSFCVLPVVDPWSGKFAQNNAARAGEYAAESIGGISVIPSRSNFGAPTYVEDALNQVVAHVLSGSVITLDLSQLSAGGNSVAVEVAWVQNGTRLTDTCTVDAALLPALPTPTEPEPPVTEPPVTQPPTTEPPTETTLAETLATEPPTTQPPTEATRPPKTGAFSARDVDWFLVFLIGGVILLIVLMAITLVVWRRDEDEEPEETAPQAEKQAPAPIHSPEPKKESRRDRKQASKEEPTKEPKQEPKKEPTKEPQQEPIKEHVKEPQQDKKEPAREPKQEPKKEPRLGFRQKPPVPAPRQDLPPREISVPGCKVRLVPVHHPESATEFTIGVNESVTLGRNKRADIILNETDTALSGLHFELQWDSRALHLQDRRSTNGTALNGVPLRPEVWMRVENKAVIQAGSDRYTVLVEKK